MKNIYLGVLVLAFSLCASNNTNSQALANFNVKTVGNTTPTGMYYAEYLPDGFDTATVTCGYPMLIVLHGIGEKGPNDGSQLSKVTVHGPAKHIKNGHNMCFTVNGKKECFVVIAPQLDVGNWTPPRIRAHYDAVMSDPLVGPKIDSNRVYLTGLSLGGIGVYWHMINPTHNKPNVFAAFAPVAGEASTTIGCSYTNLNVPMWAHHGDKDNTVPYTNDTALFNNIMSCTSPPPSTEFKFTTYPGVGHSSWNQAYDYGHSVNNPNLYEWLLTKTLPATTGNCPVNLNSIQTSQNQICLGDSVSVSLTNTSLTEFVWELDGVIDTVNHSSTFYASPGVGLHSINVWANSCDCLTDTSFNFVVIDGPVAKINTPGGSSVCRGDSVFLESDTTVDNNWVFQGNTISTNQGIYVDTEGKYSLIVDHNGTCADTTDLFITVNDSIVPVINYTNGDLISTVANTYQWYLNDTLIATATNQSFTPTKNGDYKVRTLDTNGCYATSAAYSLTYVGIGQGEHGVFEVFPNPTAGNINVKIYINGASEALVRVLDLRGAVIAEKQFSGLKKGWQNLTMNLTGVAFKGTAIVVVSTRTASGTERIIIE